MRTGTLARVLAIAVLVAACGDAQPTQAPAASQPSSEGPATTGPAPSTETAPPVSVPTALDLIRDALTAGRIDADTAMRYRVYALFGAPELPSEYRSSAWAEDNAALELAQSRLDSMPADEADTLRPFLVRPTDPASVFHAGSPTASVGLASVRTSTVTGAITCGANGWASVDGVSNFKVWGRCGAGFSDADLELVAGLLDTLWTEESTYMGRQPRVDGGTPDEGGDDRIDVYLVASCVTRQGACQTHTGLACARRAPPEAGISGSLMTSGYILMNRAKVGDPDVAAVVAHELFHVLQFAFNAEGDTSPENPWFMEASATWAEYRFVGDPTATPGRFAEYQTTNLSLQDLADDNAYRSYVWPLFMEQEAGDGTVANTWAALQGLGTYSEYMDAIDAQLPFRQHFRDFAVRDWNDDDLADVIGPMLPLGAVGSPRVEPALGRTGRSATLLPNPRGTAPIPFNVAIESLAPWFELLQVHRDVGQITLEFGGLQPRASRDVDLLVYVAGVGWDRRQVVDDKIVFCRNLPADNVTEIVVVVSNHDKDPAATVRGTWTAESLKDPCAKESTGDVSLVTVLMQHIPQYDEHSIRIDNLPDTVITIRMEAHLVIVHDEGRVLAGFGSTITYDRTVTGTNPEPPIHCQGSVGLWQGQEPSALADPNPIGQARIQGDPSSTDSELMVDIEIGSSGSAPAECWAQFGLFPFTRVDEHTWKLERHSSDIDTDRLTRSVTDDVTGTLRVP